MIRVRTAKDNQVAKTAAKGAQGWVQVTARNPRGWKRPDTKQTPVKYLRNE